MFLLIEGVDHRGNSGRCPLQPVGIRGTAGERSGVRRRGYTRDVHHLPAILERMIGPERGTLAPALARYVLTINFAPADQARYALLAQRAADGTLGAAEQVELDEYLIVNDFLTFLQSKARTSLKHLAPPEP